MSHAVSIPILVFNSGASSLKFSLYVVSQQHEHPVIIGELTGLGLAQSRIRIWEQEHWVVDDGVTLRHHTDAVQAVLTALDQRSHPRPQVIGHRFVSGGPQYFNPIRVDPTFRANILQNIHFAPLHLPAAVAVLDAVTLHFPGVPQVVCFDTTFHRDMPEEAARLPLPESLWQAGIRKYGFHGLSYEWIVRQVTPVPSRLVVAHLGNGASVAAIRQGRSLDTTMGLTPAGGVMMGTRSGDLDPGVLLYLMQALDYTAPQVDQMVNQESGLLAVSGVTADMVTLLAQGGQNPRVAQAVAMFAYSVRKAIAAMTASLEGLDMLVFTGGIGEHAAPVRAQICRSLQFLGIDLDPTANTSNAAIISTPSSMVSVRVIPTEEDRVVARHSFEIATSGRL